MQEVSVPLGIWESSYRYPSSGRDGEFENHHTVKLYQQDNHLVFESVPDASKSYLVVRLTIDDDIATGSWQEQTEADGYYQGAVYYGAIQLVVSEDRKHMTGKWVGFGKDGEVNVGPWELSFVSSQPAEAAKEPTATHA